MLNKFQRSAVGHGTGPAMVLAGPGSGKTAVIVNRIQKLIMQDHVRPQEILVITFTKAAALEMKKRFEALMGDTAYPVRFGTFHSVYFRVLKYAYHYDASQIIGEDARMRILSEVMTKEDLTLAEESAELLQEILSEISAVKSDMLTIEHYYAKSCSETLFRSLYEGYERKLRKENVIDFDDMMQLCLELFRKRPDILAGWQKQYRYILVDEFQDINRLQYEILKLLALPENNLFIVGDDDQAIYRFRGARPELMLGFERDYPKAERYLLSINYRSSDQIIEAAENLISYNRVRFEKNMTGAAGPGSPLLIGTFADRTAQAERILSHIRSYHEEGYSYEEMAVLVRTNTGAGMILHKLMEYQIPFQTKDAVPCIYDHWVCRDILAYLHAAMGSEEKEILMRIINKPCRYIARSAFSGGKTTLDQLEAMYEEKPWMAERIHQLSKDLRSVSRLAPWQAVRYIRTAIGYDSYLLQYAKEHNLEPDLLFEPLEELHAQAKDEKSIPAWFVHMDEYRTKLTSQRKKEPGERFGVTVSTMHGSKGLEYQIVFLPDVMETVIPHEKAGAASDTEEERRLFYVAMTRAKEKLHIYSAETMHGKRAAQSRFIRELKLRARPYDQKAGERA